MPQYTVTQEMLQEMPVEELKSLDMRNAAYDLYTQSYTWSTSDIQTEAQSVSMGPYVTYKGSKPKAATPKTEVEMLDERVSGVCEKGRL